MRDCYPSKYVETKKGLDEMDTKEPIFESEMRIRMEMVFLKLQIDYQKEVHISGRFIDFLIEDRIILELDGMHHFHPFYFEDKDTTTYRNLHMLLAGYRLIVISIHEYNLHREVDQLAALLTQKLSLLKETDSAAVL